MSEKRQKRQARSWFHPIYLWVVFGVMAGLVAALALMCVGPVLIAGSSRVPATPVATVLLSPTRTPIQATEGPIPMFSPPTSSPSPTHPAPPAGDIRVGDMVEVYGTGGDGLRLRLDPSREAPVRFLGAENEVFEVGEGPVEAEDYRWWYLVNPFDTSMEGWAVENYLRPLGSP